MSVGFRKSLFGFNQSDVINYIKKSADEAGRKENELKNEIESEQAKTFALTEENTKLSEELAFYQSKLNEINLLCEKLSKLYVTSKESAKAIIASTEENCRVLQNQVDTNFNTLEEIQDSLNKLKEQVNTTAGSYSNKVDSINNCLQTAKEVIISNKAESDEAIKRFNEAIL